MIRELTAAGLPDLVPNVDDNLFMATFQPQVPEEIQPPLIRMINLGQPSAIFVGPPDYTPARPHLTSLAARCGGQRVATATQSTDVPSGDDDPADRAPARAG